jgi:hypothetical protein
VRGDVSDAALATDYFAIRSGSGPVLASCSLYFDRARALCSASPRYAGIFDGKPVAVKELFSVLFDPESLKDFKDEVGGWGTT